MRIAVVLLFLPLLISSYNLDVSYLNHRYGINGPSFFGYSVGLYSERHNASGGFKSWLFVGLPIYTKGTGELLYASQPGHDAYVLKVTDLMSTVVNATSTITLKRGWLGAAMDISEKDGSVTACAPRTTLTFRSHGKIEDETLQGVCYSGSVHTGSLEIKDFPTYKRHNNPTTGFAVHYPRSQVGLESVSPIVGSPMHENVGAVHTLHQRNWTTLEEYSGNYLPLFGYAISSGNYFDKLQLIIAGGAPGWNLVGQCRANRLANAIQQVALMKYNQDNSTPFSIISKINGTELGEFFGASLATGDLNNDGLDDLIVGAPYWKNDNGRVHIYLGNEAGFFKTVIMLEGSVDNALYGYTLSSGDLDNDGFDDVIVAAPWEGSGAIYVYNGDANIEVRHSIKLSQKHTFSKWKLFGCRLSKPVDVDDNGFPDIAVGSSSPEWAGIIRSRPVVKTMITLSTVPSILLRDSTRFVVKFCIQHEPSHHFGGVMILSVDEQHNRVSETVSKYIISKWSGLQFCGEKTVYLQKSRNYMEDIGIVAKYQFNFPKHECRRVGNWSGLICPVKYKNQNPSNSTRISFDLGCGGKRTCQASISAKLEFQGIGNSTYPIGSNDLNLLLTIENDGEPAYSASVIFYIPEGVFLKKLLPSCHKEGDQQTMMVKCDVGDPVTKDMQKNISLSLAMSSLFNASLNGTTLNFTADIKTRSANQGQSKVAISLKLAADFSIALSGKSYNINRYLGFNNKPSSLDFQHNYEISQFGVTPMSKVLLKVLVPCKVGCFNFLTITQKPRVSLSDRFYQCTVSDTLDSKPQISADKSSIEATMASQLESLRTSVQNSRTSRITKADEDANQLQCGNIRSWHHTQWMTQKSNVINLNCSTPNVVCEQIECEISFLDTAYGIGRLPIQLSIGISEIIGHTQEQVTAIHLTTKASVHVSSPMPQFSVPGSGNSFSVTTSFNFSPNPITGQSIFNTIMKDVKILEEEVGILIILSSIFVGLLLLGILAVGLRHMGFFERKKEERMNLDEVEMHVFPPNNEQLIE